MRVWSVTCILGWSLLWSGRVRAQAAPPPPKVGVFIQAYGEDVVLEEQQETYDARGRSRGMRFLPACTVPCRLNLDATKTYRIAGPDISPSPPFQLPPYASQVAVQVKEGHVSDRVAGVMLSIVGTVLVVFGAVTFVVATQAEGHPDTTREFIGGSMLIAGIGAAVPGIMLRQSGKTSINLVPNAPAPPGWIAPTAFGSALRCDF
jgi:hypothetical protein